MSPELNFDEEGRQQAEELTGEIVMLVANKGWVALSAHYEEEPPAVIVRGVEVTPEVEVSESAHYQPSLL